MYLTCIISFYVFVFMEEVCHETTQITYQLSVTTTFGHTLDTAQYIFFSCSIQQKRLLFYDGRFMITWSFWLRALFYSNHKIGRWWLGETLYLWYMLLSYVMNGKAKKTIFVIKVNLGGNSTSLLTLEPFSAIVFLMCYELLACLHASEQYNFLNNTQWWIACSLFEMCICFWIL